MECKQAKNGYRIRNHENNLEVLVRFDYGYKTYAKLPKKSLLNDRVFYELEKIVSEDNLTCIDLVVEQRLDTTMCTIFVGTIGSDDHAGKVILGQGTTQRHKSDNQKRVFARSISYDRAYSDMKSDDVFVTSIDKAKLIKQMLEFGEENSGFNWTCVA